jgi:hypothetical protein
VTQSQINRAKRAASKIVKPADPTDPAILAALYEHMVTVCHAATIAINAELPKRDEFTRKRLENAKEREQWDYLFPGEPMPMDVLWTAWEAVSPDLSGLLSDILSAEQ